jgi:hypothetical protein
VIIARTFEFKQAALLEFTEAERRGRRPGQALWMTTSGSG